VPAEPNAIKLWTTGEQLPKASGVRWENGALRLDRASVRYYGLCSRDAILRSEVRFNPGVTDAGIALRAGIGTYASFYAFKLSQAGPCLVMNTHRPGAPASDYRLIRQWPPPPALAAGQWVRLELRIIGDTLTATLDGQTLGTVQDSALTGPGGALLNSNTTGFFRNVVYVPLDPAPPLEPGAVKLWTTAGSIPRQPGVQWEDGALRLDHAAALHTAADSRDAIVRADVLRANDRSNVALCLRRREDAQSKAEDCYQLVLDHPAVRLNVVRAGQRKELQSWPLHAPATNRDWVHLELRAIGDALTATCDGLELGTVHDRTLTDPGSVELSAAIHGSFRNIVYVPLDQAAPRAPAKP
jgi:hypothetical protein